MWVEQTLAEFGRSMGLENLEFTPQGTANLKFERLGQLYFERSEGHVLMYLAREITHIDMKVLRKALALCHHREQTPFPLQAGLNQNHLVFLVRIREQEFIPTTVERAIQYLDRIHQQALSLES